MRIKSCLRQSHGIFSNQKESRMKLKGGELLCVRDAKNGHLKVEDVEAVVALWI